MSKPTSHLTREVIIQRMRSARAEIDRYFLDVEHWNSLHPEEPIDGDPDGRMRRIHDAYAECLRNEARLSLESCGDIDSGDEPQETLSDEVARERAEERPTPARSSDGGPD